MLLTEWAGQGIFIEGITMMERGVRYIYLQLNMSAHRLQILFCTSDTPLYKTCQPFFFPRLLVKKKLSVYVWFQGKKIPPYFNVQNLPWQFV
jgi:hypothetical protein